MMTTDRFELNYLAVVGRCFADTGILGLAAIILIGVVLNSEIDHLDVYTTTYLDVPANSRDLVLIAIHG